MIHPRRTFEVILREQNDLIRNDLSYVQHALRKGHNENAFVVLVKACERIHDAIETLQMQIDQIQNQIDK
jgi:hypothetical protein